MTTKPTYVIKSEIGFLSAVFSGKARWSQEYPDAIVYLALAPAKRMLRDLPLTTNAAIVKNYGCSNEQIVTRPWDS